MTSLKDKRKQKPMRFSSNDITKKLVLPLWNEKALEVVDNFLTPTADIRTTFLTGQGPDSLKKSVQDTFLAFPSFEIKVDDVIQQENKLMYKWQAKAKHEGMILGVAATGKETQFSGVVFGEIANEKICVYHSFSNIPQVLSAISEKAHIGSIFENKFNLHSSLNQISTTPLTKRETECLILWIKGYSIKESARQMGDLSERTVQTYRENIKQKLRTKNFQSMLGLLQHHGIMPLLLNQP